MAKPVVVHGRGCRQRPVHDLTGSRRLDGPAIGAAAFAPGSVFIVGRPVGRGAARNLLHFGAQERRQKGALLRVNLAIEQLGEVLYILPGDIIEDHGLQWRNWSQKHALLLHLMQRIVLSEDDFRQFEHDSNRQSTIEGEGFEMAELIFEKYCRLFLPIILAFLSFFVVGAALARDLPAAPPSELARLVGEYGPDGDLVEVYEEGGRLLIDGHGLKAAQVMVNQGGFRIDQPGAPSLILKPAELTLGADHLSRRDVGAEVVEAIRSGVHADVAGLRAAAMSAQPPQEPEPERAADLVDLTTIDPAIRLDIRYATTDNFMGIALYDRPAAYLQRPAALALARVAQALGREGYGLLIHDAYRPWSVTWMFWQATPAASHVFVADPAKGSRHNRGCAVDLTLYDLATGQPVEMTGRYDEMSKRSFADYPGGTSRQRALRALLRSAMEAQGFEVYPQEWWHFDYHDWRSYGIGTASFDELAGSRP